MVPDTSKFFFKKMGNSALLNFVNSILMFLICSDKIIKLAKFATDSELYQNEYRYESMERYKKSVIRIRDILVRIRIPRIRSSE
jgi:hypothetical protein